MGAAKVTGLPPKETIEFLPSEQPRSALSMYTIADTLPGADCAQFGYRLGTLFRMARGSFLPTDQQLQALQEAESSAATL